MFRRRTSPPPDLTPAGLSEASWHVDLLTSDERDLLEHISARFHASWDWEAAAGFALDTRITTTIAVNAALLVLGLDDPIDALGDVRAVVVHPSTVVLGGEHATSVPGVMTRAPRHLAGQAQQHGPVLIAWDAVERSLRRARNPGDARADQVVLHELAHKLDMRDGVVDGTPPITDRGIHDRWVEVATRELAAVRHGASLLRPYAGTNPAEFFAVAVESFFGQPIELHDRHPALYGLLVEILGQNPAARQLRRLDAAGLLPDG